MSQDGWKMVGPRRTRRVQAPQEGEEERKTTVETSAGKTSSLVETKKPDVPKKKTSNKLKIKTEQELVGFVERVLENCPQGRITISGLGDRISDATGHTWNKKYKARFGSIRAFLSRQKNQFAFVNDVQVCLKTDVDKFTTCTSAKKPKKPKKTKLSDTGKTSCSQKSAADTLVTKSPRSTTTSGGCSCFTVFVLVALIMASASIILAVALLSKDQLADILVHLEITSNLFLEHLQHYLITLSAQFQEYYSILSLQAQEHYSILSQQVQEVFLQLTSSPSS